MTFGNGLQLCRGELVRANAVAGTWKQYSKNAIINEQVTLNRGRCDISSGLPAKVMKIFEMVSSAIVRMDNGVP